VTEASANPREFIGGNGYPYPTATDHNGTFSVTMANRLTGQPCKVRIVIGLIGVMRPEIRDVMPGGAEVADNHLLQRISRMVCCHYNLHRRDS
jgi:hypothetical protein